MSRPTTLTMLVHGEAGVGKSRLGDTSPAPRLILDAEGRAHYLPSGPKVLWDPRTEAPPVHDGSWETCIAIVPDFGTMERVYGWLQSGQHPFVSVVVDSLMEIQKRLIDMVAGMEQLKTQDWGVVLRQLEKLVRDYRDLVIVPTNPTQVVIFTVGSKLGEDGKMRAMLQGAMATTVPYFVDAVGYMYVDFHPETNQVVRSMLVQPSRVAVAKDGTGKLPGPVVQNPNIAELYQHLAAADQQAAVPSQTTPDLTQGGAPA